MLEYSILVWYVINNLSVIEREISMTTIIVKNFSEDALMDEEMSNEEYAASGISLNFIKEMDDFAVMDDDGEYLVGFDGKFWYGTCDALSMGSDCEIEWREVSDVNGHYVNYGPFFNLMEDENAYSVMVMLSFVMCSFHEFFLDEFMS